MSTSTLPARAADQRPSSSVRLFVRHYVELLLSMAAGMVVLGRVEGLVLPDLTARADVGVLVTATSTALGMGAWLRHRGHPRRGVAEMAAAMYLPVPLLLVPWCPGAASGEAVLLWGLVLMLLAMALPIPLQPGEYAS